MAIKGRRMAKSIRQRVGEFFLGDEKRKLEATTRALYEAYLEGPFLQTPDALAGLLREVDSSTLQDVVDSLYWESHSMLGYSADREQGRRRAVDESNRAFLYDVVTQWVVWVWTNYGFGQAIQITPEDELARDTLDDKGEVEDEGVWNKFWQADENQAILADHELQELSERVLVDGEVFLVYFVSTQTGSVTLRLFESTEIDRIITNPDDRKEKYFYVRRYTDGKGVVQERFYPDWHLYAAGGADLAEAKQELPTGAMLANKPGTEVMVQHVAHNRKGGLRGWPLMTAGAPWSRAHKQFRENRATVAATVAMYVNKLKVKGGSRAVDNLKSRLQSSLVNSGIMDTNPPPAGATWMQNEAADLERMPLSTGAGDAKSDGEALLLMAGLGGGIYPHWLGAGDSYRLATATSMEGPMLREFSRYQLFWSSQFRTMARIVLWSYETFSNSSTEFDTYNVEVSTDRLVETDVKELSSAIGSLYTTTIVPMSAAGVIPLDVLRDFTAGVLRIVAQAIGLDPDIASDENFEQEEIEGEETPPEGTEDVEDGSDGTEPPPGGSEAPTGPVGEAVDPTTGKVTDVGVIATPFVGDKVPLFLEDINQAIAAWDDTVSDELKGMLDTVTEQELASRRSNGQETI